MADRGHLKPKTMASLKYQDILLPACVTFLTENQTLKRVHISILTDQKESLEWETGWNQWN